MGGGRSEGANPQRAGAEVCYLLSSFRPYLGNRINPLLRSPITSLFLPPCIQCQSPISAQNSASVRSSTDFDQRSLSKAAVLGSTPSLGKFFLRHCFNRPCSLRNSFRLARHLHGDRSFVNITVNDHLLTSANFHSRSRSHSRNTPNSYREAAQSPRVSGTTIHRGATGTDGRG